jgi:hypothetical protein
MWRYRLWGIRLRWVVSSIVVGFWSLIVLAGIFGESDDKPTSASAGSTATSATSQLQPSDDPTETEEPTETPEPSDTPEPTYALQVLSPAEGSRICQFESNIVVTGTASPGSTVKRGDDEVVADQAGNWTLEADLDEGENTLKFRIEEDTDVKQDLQVTYCLPANADKAEGIIVVVDEIRDPFPDLGYPCTSQLGNRFVAVNVTFLNPGGDTESVNPSNFQLRDQNGVHWGLFDRGLESDFLESRWWVCAEPALEPVDVSGGGQTSGWLTFEIRADSRVTELYYDPVEGFWARDDIHIPIQ